MDSALLLYMNYAYTCVPKDERSHTPRRVLMDSIALQDEEAVEEAKAETSAGHTVGHLRHALWTLNWGMQCWFM